MKVDERRERLVTAAFAVIARDGAAGASTRAICAEAGMPQSAFHYAFRSKQELFMELSRTVVAEQSQVAAADEGPPCGFEESVERAIRHVLAVSVANPDQQVVITELMALELKSSDPGELNRWRFDHYATVATAVLEQLAADHAMRWRTPVEPLARMITTAMSGVIFAWLGDRDEERAYATIRPLELAVIALAEPDD